MSVFKKFIAAIACVPLLLLGLSLIAPETAVAVCDAGQLSIESGAKCAKAEEQPADLFGQAGILSKITNILLFIIGALAVIMLIIGGIRYVVSGGNQTQVTAAKNTIIYAIVGLIVAFLAYAVVGFVTSELLQS